jgi:hypothetical protein
MSLFDMLRGGDVLVVGWLDRLGRNYADVTEVIRQFMTRGVVIKTVINGLTFDGATNDPTRKAVRNALIAFWLQPPRSGAGHEGSAEGRHSARTEPHRYRGRKPSFDRDQLDTICDMLAQNASPTATPRGDRPSPLEPAAFGFTHSLRS